MDDARIARELAARAKHATLATVGLRPAGHPFASLVAVASDDEGRPLLLLSALAEHTKNLVACEKASLLVAESDLTAARVTILGACSRADDAAVRARYLEIHPDAAQWAEFKDFSFFRLE